MSLETGGEQAPIPVKTLGNSGLYIDRRLRGEAISELCASLMRVTVHHPEAEINVPHGFKEPAIDLIRSDEIRRNQALIGRTPKSKVIGGLLKDVPSLGLPLRNVELGYPRPDYDEESGVTFLSIFPSNIDLQRILETERARSQISIANTAGVNPEDIDFDSRPLDARLGYIPPNVPANITRRLLEVMEHYDDQTIIVDLMPAINTKIFKPST